MNSLLILEIDFWGDGFLSEDEEWDDGNILDGDGWNSLCKIGNICHCSISFYYFINLEKNWY